MTATTDEFDLGPFESHARIYYDRGWPPFPLPYRKKKAPPPGFTGEAGVNADTEQIDRWLRTKRGANIGVRADLIIGIDVDNYDGKNGGATLTDLEAKLGPLPPTWITTSRADDDISGVRWLRLPEYRKLITNFPGIEILQRHHRYGCVPPSIHPDTGMPYKWISPGGVPGLDPPHVADVPMLPPAWFEHLTLNNKARTEERAQAKQKARRPGPPPAGRSPRVDDTVLAAIAELRKGEGCRHDGMAAGVMALARYEERGYPGVDKALDEVRAAFVAAIGGDDKRDADKEFDGALKTARKKAGSTPATIPLWEERKSDHEFFNSLLSEELKKGAPPPPNVDPDTGEKIAPPNLPGDFWEARPELARIRQGAHARAVSADGVLGVVLARIAALTPPSLRLPATVGTEGTLDLAVTLIGSSGSGKSQSTRVATDMVPILDDDVNVVSLGSGEGIIEAYMGDVMEVDDAGKNKKVKRQVRRAVLAELDEGQALSEIGSRKGSTLLPTIRSAWSGNRLGQANASEERFRQLAPGTYRFALVAGFQLEHATAITDDAAGGTPQRILWFAAHDSTIPDDAPDWPGPIQWRPPTHTPGPLGIDPKVAAGIRARNLARARGETTGDPLDAHRDLSRLKVAGLLALLAERQHIDADDWTLAGDIMDASDRVRSGIISAARWRAHEAERGSIGAHVRRAAAIEGDAEHRALTGMAKAIGRHVHRKQCNDGCVRRCVTQATKSAHRKLATVDDALEEAQRHEWIVVDGDTITTGKLHP